MENHGNWIGSFILFRDIKEQIFLILANVQLRYVALRVRNNILWRILKNPDEKFFQKSIEEFKKSGRRFDIETCARSYRTEEAKKSCQTASKSSWKSIEEFEKKYLSSSLSWKTCQKSMEKSRRFRRFEVETCARVARPKKEENRASPRRRVLGNPLKNSKKNCCQMNSDERGVQVHGKVSTFSTFWSWNLRTSRTTEKAKKIVPHYVEEFLEILWRIRKKNCCQIISHERVVKSFEVETCARVVRPKKQKNRVKLHHRILRNPSKNSKKKFISWNERTETFDRSKKIASNCIAECFEIHRRTREKTLFREIKKKRDFW